MKNLFHGLSGKGGVLAGLLAVWLFQGCLFQEPARDIRLESEPSGALLSINGKEVGKTPYVFSDPANGKYLLHFEKEGFEPVDRIQEITPDSSKEVSVSLPKLMGLVLIESNPAGADVTVNGAFKGKTPLLCVDLPAGKHKVGFGLEGYDPRELEITIADRIPHVYLMNLKSNFASIRVESVPPGAAVILDGLHRGQTPCTVDDVLIGNHNLKLVKDGFKEHVAPLNITQTGIFPVQVKLEERLASVEVTSTPSDIKVTLGNGYRGRTPITIPNLRDGSYPLILEHPSYITTNLTAEIRGNQDAKVDVVMEKGTGILVLNVTPTGANIFVNAESRGASVEKPLELELPPGTYKVEVSKARHQTAVLDNIQLNARETIKKDIFLRAIWTKDTVVTLKDGRVKDGMLILKRPNGSIKIETQRGIFEEFTAEEIQSLEPIKP